MHWLYLIFSRAPVKQHPSCVNLQMGASAASITSSSRAQITGTSGLCWSSGAVLKHDDTVTPWQGPLLLPENTRHWIIVGSMLGHRRRRWPSNEPTMIECLVFAGILPRGRGVLHNITSRAWQNLIWRNIDLTGRVPAHRPVRRVHFVTSVLKGRICHLAKWQIRPFKTEMTICSREIIQASTKRWPNVGMMLDQIVNIS